MEDKSMEKHLSFRYATRKDVDLIYSFILKLAEYEGMPEAYKNDNYDKDSIDIYCDNFVSDKSRFILLQRTENS